jgi:ribosomal protein S6E (S10)
MGTEGKKIGGQKDRWAKRLVGKKIGGQKDWWAKRLVGKKIGGQKDWWAKMRCCSGSRASGQLT